MQKGPTVMTWFGTPTVDMSTINLTWPRHEPSYLGIFGEFYEAKKVCEFTIFADRLSFFGGLNALPMCVGQLVRPLKKRLCLTRRHFPYGHAQKWGLPSGKRLHNSGKIHPFFMGKLTISMAIFNSYGKIRHY